MAKVLITEQILQDTADAIREKTGSSEGIKPSEFPENIGDIPAGADLSDYFTDTLSYSGIGASTNEPVSGIAGSLKKIPNMPVPVLGNVSALFAGCKNLENIDVINNWNTSHFTNTSWMFDSCQSLISISAFDTSNVTNIDSMFSGCSLLETVGFFDFSSVTSANTLFAGCNHLINIPAFNMPNVTNIWRMFYSISNLLTDTSLDNILLTLISMTSYTGTKTLANLGFTSSAYSSAKIQSLPHYQDFVNAGWTIGY